VTKLESARVALDRAGMRRIAGAALGAVALLIFASVVLVRSDEALFLTVLTGLGMMVASVIILARGEPDPGASAGVPGSVEIDGRDVVIDVGGERVVLPVWRLETAYVERVGDEQNLMLRFRGKVLVRASLDSKYDVARARELLAAAHLDARRVALVVNSEARGGRILAGCLTTVVMALVLPWPLLGLVQTFAVHGGKRIGMAFFTGALLPVLIALPALYLTLRALRPALLVVGRDGVAFSKGLRKWFVRHEDLRQVTFRQEGLDLEHTGGTLEVTCPQPTAEAIDQILTEVHQARERGDAPAIPAAILERGTRSVEQWEEDLATLLERAERSYRELGFGVSELLRVVEDARAPLERRLAAARALAPIRDAHPRMRIAAEACADPRTRVALEHAADGELDTAAVDEALRAEAQADAARASRR
jgi:hypothetical protein